MYNFAPRMETMEPTSKTLDAVRSPLVFNALVTLLLTGVVVGILATSLPDWFRMSVVAFYFVWLSLMALWVYMSYRKDPRGLTYGPDHYIQESRMAYDHKLALAKLSVAQTSKGQR